MANKKHLGDLPEAMITEVFIRLPVRSLLQCKSVCKPWLSTISNPHFVKSYIHHSITTCRHDPTLLNLIDERQLALYAREPFEYPANPTPDDLQHQQRRRQLINQALDDASRQDLSESGLQFRRVSLPRPFQAARFVNCCNGIICLSSHINVYLWNPSINKLKKLHFPYKVVGNLAATIGFGYDSISNEYKLIRLVYGNMNDDLPIAKVYYVNADSCREFQGPTLSLNLLQRPSYIVVNGVLYFGGDQLLSFDLHDEVFGLVPFPNTIQRKRLDIMDFEGSVAIGFESGTGFDLWAFDKVELSWTKMFNIEYGMNDLDVGIQLSCYLGAKQFHGELLRDGKHFVHEILYDYEKKETKYYGLKEEYINFFAALEELEISARAIFIDYSAPVHAAFKYTETLVSLNGFEPVEDARNQILSLEDSIHD